MERSTQAPDESAAAKQQISLLQAELDARDSQIAQLAQDIQKLQERNRQLLVKSEGIKAELKNENERVRAAKIELKERNIPEDSPEAVYQLKQLADSAEIKNKEYNAIVDHLRREVEIIAAERDALEARATPTVSTDLKSLEDVIAALEQDESSSGSSPEEIKAKATILWNRLNFLTTDSPLAEKDARTTPADELEVLEEPLHTEQGEEFSQDETTAEDDQPIEQGDDGTPELPQGDRDRVLAYIGKGKAARPTAGGSKPSSGRPHK